jgi:hypothetical protein
MPRVEEAPKDPKPAMFRSYAAPVERNPFVNIDMLVKPPIDATQEALNQYGRAGYLRQALSVDKRIQEQQILQQSVESKVNAIVNDEYERRRAVKRGVYESIGMTPAEIDEKFASQVLQGQQAAITRATTDGQVRDALVRYFTLRGGVVPAFLQPPVTTATGTNTATGMAGAAAAGLDDEEGAEPDYAAEAEDQAELGAAGAAPAIPAAGNPFELTPDEDSQIEALVSDARVYTRGSGPPTKATMIKYLLFNNIDIQLPSGNVTRSPTTANQRLSWADLAAQVMEAFAGIAGAAAPVARAGGGAAAAPEGGYAEAEDDDDIDALFAEEDGGGYGAAGGGAALPNPSLKK